MPRNSGGRDTVVIGIANAASRKGEFPQIQGQATNGRFSGGGPVTTVDTTHDAASATCHCGVFLGMYERYFSVAASI